jgi:hypothetical protein
MALWQFTVIAVLMGALLVHTSFLTRRIGRANAALKRIEAALLAKVEVATPAPTAPVEATQPLELTDMEDSAARYLTIRDLKVRSELQRSHATARLEIPDAPDMNGKFASLLFGRGKQENSVPASSESSDAPNTSAEAPNTGTEPPSSHTSLAENENSVPPSPQTGDAPNASTEPPHSPASPTVNEETVEQKERDALLFMSGQRRRRRARQGY